MKKKIFIPDCDHERELRQILRVVRRGDEIQVWSFLGCAECGLPWGPVEIKIVGGGNVSSTTKQN